MADVTILNINGTDYDIKDTKSRFPQWNTDPATGLPVSGEYIGTSVKKITQYLNRLGELAYKDSLTDQEIISFLGYTPVNTEDFQSAITDLQTNFQAGVDAVYNAVVAKGSTPASHSLSDVVTAIGNISTGGLYMTKEIHEDGTYYPSDDGADAYSLVIVSKDVGQPHTVVFYDTDGETILKTQANVPYHGNATCTLLDGKVINNQYFKGWNPSPINIVRDTFCYPQFGDYVIESGEIEDDWETICSNGGTNYPLGSYKSLIITIPQHYYDIEFNNAHSGALEERSFYVASRGYAIQMVKVAEGEDGSNSTWLSKDHISISDDNHPYQGDPPNRITDVFNNDGYSVNEMQFDWGNCFIRSWLNDEFLSLLPLCLQNSIQTVNKYYKGYYTYDFANISTWTLAEKSSLDKIWVPSVKELNSLISTYGVNISYNAYGSNLSDYTELNGIDYSLIFTPNYPSSSHRSYRTSAGTIVRRYDPGIIKSFLASAGAVPEIQFGSSSGFANVLFGFCL